MMQSDHVALAVLARVLPGPGMTSPFLSPKSQLTVTVTRTSLSYHLESFTPGTSAKWGVHIYAEYAEYGQCSILHIGFSVCILFCILQHILLHIMVHITLHIILHILTY
jgi:hypothetical protein